MAHPLLCIDTASLVFQSIVNDGDIEAFLVTCKVTNELLSYSWRDVLHKCAILGNKKPVSFCYLEKSRLYLASDDSEKLRLAKELYKIVHDVPFVWMVKCPVMKAYIDRLATFEKGLSEACTTNDVDAVRNILADNAGTFVEIPCTSFSEAVVRGFAEIVHILRAHDIGPVRSGHRHPVEMAACNGQAEMIAIVAPVYKGMHPLILDPQEYTTDVLKALVANQYLDCEVADRVLRVELVDPPTS